MAKNGRMRLRVTIPRSLLNQGPNQALFQWWREHLIPAWLARPDGVKLELVFPPVEEEEEEEEED